MVYSYNEGYIADNFIFKILDVNSAFETYTFVKKAKDIPFNAMFHQRERNIVFITLLEWEDNISHQKVRIIWQIPAT